MQRFFHYLPIAFFFAACTTTFNFTGGSLNTELETISIAQFINESPVIVPALAQDLTEAIQDLFLSQSRLSLASGAADINISGIITNYSIDPVAFTGTSNTPGSSSIPRTAQNRLKISIRVKYENNVEPDDNWEQTFSSFSDFDATEDFTSIEQEQIELILEQLTQDIFNKSLGKW